MGGSRNWQSAARSGVLGVAVALLSLLTCASVGQAQSLVAGDISGVVTDPSAAVISGATVTLTSLDTGSTQSSTSGSDGTYRFNLLKPGRYELTLERTGFAKIVTDVDVIVGQTIVANLKLELSSQKGETVEVSGVAPLINLDPGSSTSFTQKELELLPSGGSDITNIAFTAPGVVVNVTGGYGNFTANGLPATSNLFTINGENDMDPYFNINNSGASNLTLGQNEIQEATVTTNPYSGEYGQLIGSQVTYVTKSGSNQFHGNAVYSWNGRALNANNFFNNATAQPRPFANANQWAASVGGPIFKNKTFFFIDTEGMRFILPNADTSTIPTPAFSAAVLANVQANQPNEAAAYTSMLGIWANAKAGTPIPVATPACNSASLSLPGFTPNAAGDNCAESITTTPTAFAKEWIIAGRVDQKITAKDNAFFRYKVDHGLQPTTIDPFDHRFDANSNQPAWDAQANETHIFGSRATNAFTASLSHYVALFNQNASLVNSVFPYAIIFQSTSAPFTGPNFSGEAFPQGRNITQYQFIDDFSLNRGRHNLKFGINFRRYDVSDHNFFYNTPRIYFNNIPTLPDKSENGLQSFADGVAFQYRRSRNLSSDVPVALWGTGFYASDEWKVLPRLTLTLALRAEHNSNPVCQTNCFANFSGPFSSLASVQAAGSGSDPGAVPYSSDITYNQHQAYKGTDKLNLSPRVAFSWSPLASSKTVISGGFGIFYDNPAAGLVDDLLANPPASVALRVRPTTGTLPFDTTAAGAAATYQAASSAFDITQSYNQIKATLNAQGVTFTAPAVTTIIGTIHSPQAQEWNLKLQQQVGRNTALTVNYVGNHVIHIPYTNAWPNAYDAACLFGDASCNPLVPGVSESGPVVPNYGTVTEVRSGAISNYNGVSFSVREQFTSWFLAHVNYTYSHNLDEVSNGGIFTYGDSILGQINPISLRANNYGNSDYDIRNLFSADYVLTPKFHFANKFLSQAIGGWEWSGKVFARSGLPFSVLDGNWNGGTFGNGGGDIFAYPLAGNVQTTCGGSNVNTNASPVGCLSSAAYINSGASTFTGYSTWSNQTRNQYRGPHYFDMDMSLYKTFRLKERLSLGVGASAYNVFNHPNFNLPDNNLGSGTFGQVTSTVGTPTSPYGNFLGFDSSVRVVQLNAKIVF